MNSWDFTEWNVPKYGVFSGPYSPAFGLNVERYEVFYYEAFYYLFDSMVLVI